MFGPAGADGLAAAGEADLADSAADLAAAMSACCWAATCC